MPRRARAWPRAGPLGHESVQGDGDDQVLVAEDEPRRDVLPCWGVGGQWFGEGGFGGRALGRSHHGGLRCGHVGGELLVERVLPDGELVAAGGDRVGAGGVGEGAAGEHGPQLERRLPVLGREPVHVHESDHGVVVCRGLGDHHAAVGVGDEHDGLADAADDVAHVGGVAGEAAQRVGRGDDLVAAGPEQFDDRAPAVGLGEGAVDEHERGVCSDMDLPLVVTSGRRPLVPSALRRMWIACSRAAVVAAVPRTGLSMRKSRMMPLNRTPVVRTPASVSLRA